MKFENIFSQKIVEGQATRYIYFFLFDSPFIKAQKRSTKA